MSNNEKLHFILDIDNTLVHSLTPTEYKKISYYNKQKYKYIIMDNDFVVMLRPHLSTFLRFLFDNYIVSLWSYGSQQYVAWIVKNVIMPEMRPTDKLEYILFEYHCKKSEQQYKAQKRIKMINKVDKNVDLKKTILIDDLDLNCKGQFAIKVVAFDLLSEKNYSDNNYLLNLIKEIKKLK